MVQNQVRPILPAVDLETKTVLKRAVLATRSLAELKGKTKTIPNESILISTLTLQEAKDSSAVENIITTHDELYKATLFSDYIGNPAAKEVANYALALYTGFNLVKEHEILTINHILKIQEILEGNKAGFRKLPGTTIKNMSTGKVVYTPPQDHQEITSLMTELIGVVNDDELCDYDPLIKMAIIHFQFESIHPFYDGNGRTGRIINILYLVIKRLLDIPVLYLSRYIIQNKPEYYSLLQSVRDTGNWEPWLLFMLNAVHHTSLETIRIIDAIGSIMQDYKHRIRQSFPNIYSQDLINNLFKCPYTKIASLQKDLNVSRLTATRYLSELTKAGFLEKYKISRNNYYVNPPLLNLLSNESEQV